MRERCINERVRDEEEVMITITLLNGKPGLRVVTIDTKRDREREIYREGVKDEEKIGKDKK